MSVKLFIDKPVNLHKLIEELAEAGFMQTSSKENEFIIHDSDDETTVMAIYDAHDPTIIEQAELVFDKPLRAPSITVDDIFVESREIKTNPTEALLEALAESKKGKGNAKSLDLIARSLLPVIEDLMKRVEKLEKK